MARDFAPSPGVGCALPAGVPACRRSSLLRRLMLTFPTWSFRERVSGAALLKNRRKVVPRLKGQVDTAL